MEFCVFAQFYVFGKFLSYSCVFRMFRASEAQEIKVECRAHPTGGILHASVSGRQANAYAVL